jgi:hypothetical protein
VDEDAAPFSPVHLGTSHEMLMAFLGHLLGISPLYFYRVIGRALAAFSIPFVFYWCVRRFELSRWQALCGAVCAIIFLLADTVGQASFGNTAFGHMWHGKAIVWILLLPVVLSLTYRFLRTGKSTDILWLTFLAIAGVGLSNSALYLFPATMGCAALAHVFNELSLHKDWRNVGGVMQRCLWLVVPFAYPISILLLHKFNIVPRPVDIRGFGTNYIPWIQGINYVVGQGPQHLRNVVLMLLVPALVIGGRRGMFFLAYISLVWLLCLNPFLAHGWMKNIFAVCYFRLNYLVPLPLLCAMIPDTAWKRSPVPSRLLGNRMVLAVGVGAIVAVILFSSPSLMILPRPGQFEWKSPSDLQFERNNLAFARVAGSYLEHSKLLAPGWTASCELPLLFPEMKVVAPRLVMHYFANAGKTNEGLVRRMAQAFIETDPLYVLRRDVRRTNVQRFVLS